MVGLVTLGYGPLGAVIGYTIAALAAGVVGILLMAYLYRKRIKVKGILEVKKYLKISLNYGLPVYACNINRRFNPVLRFLLPLFYEGNIMIGNYQIATTFIVLIGFFSTPISAMLFPAFSKLNY